VLALSLVAAAIVGIFSFPARRRLESFANLRVYGEREAPEAALRTFATRMSRAVPMDELLLQLTEILRKTMALAAAEVWTGSDGTYELAVSVPDRSAPRLVLGPDERSVAARAHVAGNTWLAVWVPALLRDGATVRVAPIAHLGELLGFIVAERRATETDFDEDEDRVLSDLARQLGLALHNVRLDTALQASLDELQVRNAELVASRARIVAAADESRRGIERNLHDGAQQRLVALSLELTMLEDRLAHDPDSVARFERARNEIAMSLTELRELAHGLHPAVVSAHGLDVALEQVAARASVPVSLTIAIRGRLPEALEVAVFYLVCESLANVGKYAEASAASVEVTREEGRVVVEIVDDGVGGADSERGTGLRGLADRVEALNGRLRVWSPAGRGTRVRAELPCV
jgi:signal transduction histidine kinase